MEGGNPLADIAGATSATALVTWSSAAAAVKVRGKGYVRRPRLATDGSADVERIE